MKARSMWVALLGIGFVLLLGVSLALARNALGPPAAPVETPLGDAFTYQGELVRGTDPVSETCQMEFRLYDSGDGGLQAGGPITTPVDVQDGRFTVQLDFGPDAFTGEARWLGIAVKCPSDPEFVPFPERQALTAAPYALHAKTAGAAPWDGLTGVPAGFVDDTDDIDDADADPSNELNTAMSLVDSTLVLTDTGGAVSVDLGELAAMGQMVRDFVVHAGENVVAGDLVTWMHGEVYGSDPRWGDESVFFPDPINEVDLVALTETDFLVAYRDGSNHGVAITGTVNGLGVTWGSPSTFYAGTVWLLDVAALSDTDFVIAYLDGDNASHGTAVAGTVAGGSFFWGTPSVFNAGSSHNIGAAALSANEVVVVYGDGGSANHGTAITGTLTGGSLTWGSPSVFHSATTYEIELAALSGGEVAIAFRDYDNSGLGTAITGTVNGGSWSWGSPSVFNPGDTAHIDLAALSDTKVVVAYRNLDNDDLGTVVVGTVSGGELAWGPESVFNPAATSSINLAALSESDLVVVYRDSDNAEYGTAVLGDLSSGELLWSIESVFRADRTLETAVAPLPASDFVVAYKADDDQHGTVRVPNLIGRRPIGTAKNAAGGGETVTVVLDGVSDVHTGLIPGQVYYWQADGSLGTTPTPVRVGLALSPAELLLDQLWPN